MSLVKDSLATAATVALVGSVMEGKTRQQLAALEATYAEALGIPLEEARQRLQVLGEAQAAADQKAAVMRLVQRGLGVNEIRAEIYCRYILEAMRRNGTGHLREFRRFALALRAQRPARGLLHRFRVRQRYQRLHAARNNRAST